MNRKRLKPPKLVPRKGVYCLYCGTGAMYGVAKVSGWLIMGCAALCPSHKHIRGSFREGCVTINLGDCEDRRKCQ